MYTDHVSPINQYAHLHKLVMIHGLVRSEEYEHMRHLNKVYHRARVMSVAAFVFSYSIIVQGAFFFLSSSPLFSLLLTELEHFSGSLFSVLTSVL